MEVAFEPVERLAADRGAAAVAPEVVGGLCVVRGAWCRWRLIGWAGRSSFAGARRMVAPELVGRLCVVRGDGIRRRWRLNWWVGRQPFVGAGAGGA